MKKILILFAICTNVQIKTKSQNVGVGTINPLSKFSVGLNSQFQIDSTGNIIKINNIATSFPLTQGGSGQVLVNDGNGNLSWQSINSLSTKLLLLDTSSFNTLIAINSTPTTVFSFVIPPNTLNANKALRIRCNFLGGNSGGSIQSDFVLRFDTTDMTYANVYLPVSLYGFNSYIYGSLDMIVYGITPNTQTCDAVLYTVAQNNAATLFKPAINNPNGTNGRKSVDCTQPILAKIVFTGILSGNASVQIDRFLAWIE